MCTIYTHTYMYIHTQGPQKTPGPGPMHQQRMHTGGSCHHQHFAVPKRGAGLASGAFKPKQAYKPTPAWQSAFARAVQRTSPVPCVASSWGCGFGGARSVAEAAMLTEAHRWLAAVVRETTKARRLRGGAVPPLGLVGAGSLGCVTNLGFPSAHTVSAW